MRTRPLLLAVSLTLALVPGARALDGPAPEPLTTRTFRVTHIPLSDAIGVALDACAPTGGCEVGTAEGLLRVVASQGQQLIVADALRKSDVPPPTGVFTIFVLGDWGGGGEVPEAARKAVNDLQAVMPGKTFRLRESAQFRADRMADLALGGYNFSMRFRPLAPGSREILIDSLELAPRIKTSLRMKLGETVVVGTSRAITGDGTIALVLSSAPAP
jgi:hypothetical protein